METPIKMMIGMYLPSELSKYNSIIALKLKFDCTYFKNI